MKCPYCEGTGETTAEAIGFGGMITLARKKAGLKQEQLAEKVGVGRSHIAAIETGRSSIPIESVRAYATALNLKPEDLIP